MRAYRVEIQHGRKFTFPFLPKSLCLEASRSPYLGDDGALQNIVRNSCHQQHQAVNSGRDCGVDGFRPSMLFVNGKSDSQNSR